MMWSQKYDAWLKSENGSWVRESAIVRISPSGSRVSLAHLIDGTQVTFLAPPDKLIQQIANPVGDDL